MGKKDDWCSEKGLKNRQRGMYKNESKQKKVCTSICFSCSALVYLIFAGISLERASNAGRINSDFEAINFSGNSLTTAFIDNAYDSCSIPYYDTDNFGAS